MNFYSKVGNEIVWTKEDGIYQIYRELVEESLFYGLNPDRYRINFSFNKVVDDILITDRLLQLAYDNYFGSVEPKEVYKTWNYPKKRDRVIDELISISGKLDKDIFFERFSPKYPQFHNLVEKYRGYYSLNKNFRQRFIKLRKPLRLGDRHDAIPYIKEFLYLIGDLDSIDSIDSPEFDLMLEEGVKRFQRRHGLNPDGVIGRATLREINYPLEERLKSIAINMEKIRWLPEYLNPNRIEVNIPSYSLDFYRENRYQFSMKVIVGKKEGDDFRPTFIYSGKVEEVVFYPFWHVPDNIAVKDIFPKIRKNPSYLEKNNFIVIYGGRRVNPSRINWYAVSPYGFKFIQLPGEKNSLGKVKIVFQNPFDIYLHDTPYKELFEKERRAFSSGCIRVENAELLTKSILEMEGYDDDTVDLLFRSGETRQIQIKSPLMVYILYNTVVVKDNTIHFYNDVYGYDKIVRSKLLKDGDD